MKKLLTILGVTLALFSGCRGSGDVVSLYFHVDVVDAVGDLTVVPDYEKRTLDLKLTWEANEFRGVVGGEFFDRFETAVELVRELEAGEPAPTFVVTLEGNDDERVVVGRDYESPEEMEPLVDFYEDIKELLTASVPL